MDTATKSVPANDIIAKARKILASLEGKTNLDVVKQLSQDFVASATACLENDAPVEQVVAIQLALAAHLCLGLTEGARNPAVVLMSIAKVVGWLDVADDLKSRSQEVH